MAGLLDSLNDLDTYSRSITDAELWSPYVRQVCARHEIPCSTIRPGLAGTFPTFIVDDTSVVKFFGKLFDGWQSYEVEREANLLIAGLASFPSPRLLSGGYLDEDEAGSWRYMVFDFLDGTSLGEIYEQVILEEKVRAARELGRWMRQLHDLPLPQAGFFTPDWSRYLGLLKKLSAGCTSAQQAWGSLPGRLVDQIDEYMLPVANLVDFGSSPHLIHADLTGDHLLGRLEAGRWKTSGIIDWGDAMVGNILYELVALHIDLFGCEKHMLVKFLEAYVLPPFFLQDFSRKAMCLTLLHRFDALVTVFRHHPEFRQAATLADLARVIWEV